MSCCSQLSLLATITNKLFGPHKANIEISDGFYWIGLFYGVYSTFALVYVCAVEVLLKMQSQMKQTQIKKCPKKKIKKICAGCMISNTVVFLIGVVIVSWIVFRSLSFFLNFIRTDYFELLKSILTEYSNEMIISKVFDFAQLPQVFMHDLFTINAKTKGFLKSVITNILNLMANKALLDGMETFSILSGKSSSIDIRSMLSPIQYPLPSNQNHMDVTLMIFFDIFHMKLGTIVAMILLNIERLLGVIVIVYILGMFLWTMKTVYSTWIVMKSTTGTFRSNLTSHICTLFGIFIFSVVMLVYWRALNWRHIAQIFIYSSVQKFDHNNKLREYSAIMIKNATKWMKNATKSMKNNHVVFKEAFFSFHSQLSNEERAKSLEFIFKVFAQIGKLDQAKWNDEAFLAFLTVPESYIQYWLDKTHIQILVISLFKPFKEFEGDLEEISKDFTRVSKNIISLYSHFMSNEEVVDFEIVATNILLYLDIALDDLLGKIDDVIPQSDTNHEERYRFNDPDVKIWYDFIGLLKIDNLFGLYDSIANLFFPKLHKSTA